MHMAKNMTKSSVEVDGLKQASKEDFNQPILVFRIFFSKHVIPKIIFNINGKSTQI